MMSSKLGGGSVEDLDRNLLQAGSIYKLVTILMSWLSVQVADLWLTAYWLNLLCPIFEYQFFAVYYIVRLWASQRRKGPENIPQSPHPLLKVHPSTQAAVPEQLFEEKVLWIR